MKWQWEMPQITQKVVTHKYFHDIVEKERKNYYPGIERNVQTHKLHEEGKCNCGYKARGMWV
jgi:hypothetical protein